MASEANHRVAAVGPTTPATPARPPARCKRGAPCSPAAEVGRGGRDDAESELNRARTVTIADADDRSFFEGDLAAEPWFGVEI